jgi:Protein kinase domain
MPPFCLRHDIGEVIKERYTIREVLGAGAFGTVYRVEETLGSRVVTLACKEMHVLTDPSTPGDERTAALRLFQEEAYLLQTLRNPHIPAAYFESAKGVWLACPICGRTFHSVATCPRHGCALQVVEERYYLMMDFIEGPDLEAMLLANNGRPLAEDDVLDWALQVCDALEAVHAKGLSHRDIKPANIKILRDVSRAMLIDFGLVKPATVSGGYGTVQKRGSTGVGTVGYAPESLQEQLQPDARTDILALGMTLYRLLTRRDPTDPNDLSDMRRTPPSALNRNLSPLVDAIILRAIQPDRDRRYPDVASLRQELRAARYPIETVCPHCGWVQRSAASPGPDTRCGRCGRPLGASASTQAQGGRATAPSLDPLSMVRGAVKTKPNPHERRIAEIRTELRNPPAPPAYVHEARIQEIEGILPQVAQLSVGHISQCPACRQADLMVISGRPTGKCPLCQSAQLLRRQWDETLCSICRDGEVVEHEIYNDQSAFGMGFCPICRAMPLQEERRKRFGLTLDSWAVCPQCEAEFDFLTGGRARLSSYKEDPFGIGERYREQTLPVAEWRRLAERSDRYCFCLQCIAQFDVLEDGRLKLVLLNSDPYGVGAQYKDAVLSRAEWGKLAQGMALTVGNLHCPQCRAEFDYDRDARTLKLLQDSLTVPVWARQWKGQPVALQAWYLMASGKRSPHPGLLCPACKTEFDHERNDLKLITAPPGALSALLGQVLSMQDWQRRARGLPIGSEAQQLRNELQRLQAKKQQERAQFQRNWQRRHGQLQAELMELLKDSVLGGFIPLQRMSQYASAADNDTDDGLVIVFKGDARRIQLRAGEHLRWESPASQCSVKMSGGIFYWQREATGTLVVSSDRVLFQGDGPDDRLWQRTLARLQAAEVHRVQDAMVAGLTFEDLHKPVGFEMNSVAWDIIVDGDAYSLVFSAHDLVEMLNQLVTST